ncbi:MAG: M20/M25/M40 family metallo-hydrolase [Candidatus Hydrothermarchaeota archaeon]
MFTMRSLIDELVKLIEIPSPSGEEDKILRYIEKRLNELDIPFERQNVKKNYNLIVNPLDDPELIICTHVDTIPLLYHQTLRAEVEGERVYGLGSADAKGGILSILLTLETIKEKENLRKFPVTFAFLVDEEGDGSGSEKLADQYTSKYGIVLEPTGLDICVAGAGSFEIEIEVIGKEAHGSAIEFGENAIMKAIDVIEKINELSFLNEEHELIGKSLYNIQRIEGGFDALIVPKKCKMVLDFRILPNQDAKKIKKELHDYFDSKGIEYKLTDESMPFEINMDAEIVSLLKKAYKDVLGKDAKIRGMKSWTDAQNLYERGIEPVVFGPGRLETSHTSNEYVDVEDIILASKILYRAISYLV